MGLRRNWGSGRGVKMGMTEEEYQEKIPSWCHYQTVEQHVECLMLCWGITGGFVSLKDSGYCESCDLYRNKGD